MCRSRPVCWALFLGLLLMLSGLSPAAANCADDNMTCLDARVTTQIQKILKKKKYYNGPIDGAYSKKLRAALDDFMEDNGEVRLLTPEAIKALWGLDIDYKIADSEERLKFLKAIGIDK